MGTSSYFSVKQNTTESKMCEMRSIVHQLHYTNLPRNYSTKPRLRKKDRSDRGQSL